MRTFDIARIVATGATCGAALLATATAQAAPFTNGSFERPGGVAEGDYRELLPGDTTLPGWTVIGDGVDYLHRVAGSPPAAGEYNLDLNRLDAGGVEQTFTTTPGTDYTVRFKLSYNTACDVEGGRLFVRADDAVGGTRDIEGATPQEQTYQFRADADGSTRLRFRSSPDNAIACGPVLDDVRVRASALLDAFGFNGEDRPVFTSAPLTAGRRYRIEVYGTHSSWDRTLMAPDGQRARNWVVCGTPEAAPLTPTEVLPNGRVGEDPAFVFALPQTGRACNPKFRTLLPAKRSSLEYDLERPGTFAPLPRPDGDPAAPTAGHAYTYTITGRGAPLAIRFGDRNTSDNRGQYDLRVVPVGG